MSIEGNQTKWENIRTDYLRYERERELGIPKEIKGLFMCNTIYNYSTFPQILIKNYKNGNKEDILSLEWFLKLQTTVSIILTKNQYETNKKENQIQARVLLDFLQHSTVTKDLFNEEINIYHMHPSYKIETIKIYQISDDLEKLRELYGVMQKHLHYFYNCPPYRALVAHYH